MNEAKPKRGPGCLGWIMLILVLLLCGMLLFFRSFEPAPPPEPEDDPQADAGIAALSEILEAESVVRARLRNPRSAQFSSTGLYRGRDGKLRVCGQVNSENGFGGMTGPQRFVEGNGHAFLEEEMSGELMAKLWAEACPGEGLIRRGLR